MFWNESSKTTGISQALSAHKPVLLSLYNPGSAQKRSIKIYVPDQNLKIVGVDNSSIAGDIVCTDTVNTANCELFFEVDLP